MSITQTMKETWQYFLEALQPNDRQKLIEVLRADYEEQAQAAAQLTHHAYQMYYPQFRERLLRIADEEQAHVRWLREKILALNGTIPQLTLSPKPGRNSWECLLMDLEEEKQFCHAMLQQIFVADQIDPEIAEGLQRLRKDERRHRTEIEEMLMQSDANASPPDPSVGNEQLQKQQHAWLEQQKMIWLNTRRATWEAGGKQTPWAEWLGECEAEWAAQLPDRELEWVRQYERTHTKTA